MLILALLAGLVDGEAAKLGADDYEVREAAHARLDNPLTALFLPAFSDDPEVARRLAELRARNLGWMRAERLERIAYRDDYGLWLDAWFCLGRSLIAVEDVHAGLCESFERARLLQLRWEGIYTQWEGGAFGLTVDLNEFREVCDFNRCTAPQPREVQPKG